MASESAPAAPKVDHLVVLDDETVIASVVARLLKGIADQLTTGATAQDGLTTVRKIMGETPEGEAAPQILLVSDNTMPAADGAEVKQGFELIAQLIKEFGPRIAMILYSADHPEDFKLLPEKVDEIVGTEQGHVVYLAKPATPSNLRAAAAQAIANVYGSASTTE